MAEQSSSGDVAAGIIGKIMKGEGYGTTAPPPLNKDASGWLVRLANLNLSVCVLACHVYIFHTIDTLNYVVYSVYVCTICSKMKSIQSSLH